jgi:hypothetical protein
MFNHALLGKWCDAMQLREMPGQELWWTPNIVVYWAGGAPLCPQEPQGRGCERILEKVRRLSQATPNLKWGLGLKLAFGMTCTMTI